MPDTLLVAFPFVLAGVLLASGIAKLRRPDDLAGWNSMGVHSVLRRDWLLRLHPWAEIALAIALLALGGVLGLAAAVVATALMGVYLVMVWQVAHRPEDASCACFGTRRAITGVTVVRNAWLTLLAVATAGVIWANPLWGGAVVTAATAPSGWAVVVALAVTMVTVALILWPESTATPNSSQDVIVEDGPNGQELDYVRTRTPAVPVTLADGTVVNLRTLASLRPILLLVVSETCGACTTTLERVPEWRERLPEVDVRLLIHARPEDSTLADTTEPQTLHDPEHYVRGSIQDWATPTALLLGADGLLAGGPEVGPTAVADFIDDVDVALHGTV